MLSPIHEPSAIYGTVLDEKTPKRSAFRFNLAIALLIWAMWLALGDRLAIYHLFAGWQVALTMVFGSLVGGGTSEGGGAIAFPIFTKLLHIAPRDARDFSLAIQSVGMGAASLSILYLRIPLERRALLRRDSWVVGVIVGAYFVAPMILPVFVRTSFTVLVSSMGVALLLINREKTVLHDERITIRVNLSSEAASMNLRTCSFVSVGCEMAEVRVSRTHRRPLRTTTGFEDREDHRSLSTSCTIANT